MKLKNKNDSPVTFSDVIYNYLDINFDTQMIMIL